MTSDERKEGMEPVAWRVKDYADGWVLYHTEEGARRSGLARNEVPEP